MNDTPPKKPFVVPGIGKREIIIAVVAGLVLIAFIGFGITRLGHQATGDWLTGKITEKNFKPYPQTEISVGTRGLQSQQIEGDFTFNVRVPNDRDYTVWVDRTSYDAKKVGDSFRFPRPPAEN